ncbi:MAG: DUF4298 domain-containing protein [Erysipelotrichaceae bacterium]|nr:DUF4298 domain-containing protein [Erysipelotrichaceae bacterium]
MTKKSKQTVRIEQMEKLFDEAESSVSEMKKCLDRYIRTQKKIAELEDYYSSGKWRRDYEDDEKGKLPQDLKRGVLSQDGLYDLLNENDELIAKMERFLKKHHD